MNVKLTQYELQAITERAEKATEGPWKLSYTGVSNLDGKDVLWATINEDIYGNKADVDFVLNARQDIPKLLAEIKRLQAEVHEHSAHNGQLIATHVIPTKEENKRLKAEVERMNKLMWEVNEIIDYVATQMARAHYGTSEGLDDESIEEYIDRLREVTL